MLQKNNSNFLITWRCKKYNSNFLILSRDMLSPDIVPFSFFQLGVKCSHAGRESELEIRSPSMEIFWGNMSKSFSWPPFCHSLTTVLPSPRAELHHSSSSPSPSLSLLLGRTWNFLVFLIPKILVVWSPLQLVGMKKLLNWPARAQFWCQAHFQGKGFCCLPPP